MRSKGNNSARVPALALAAGLILTAGLAVPALADTLNGPGFEGKTITVYTETTAANNPAYDTGWSGGAGPGNSGSNPSGGTSKDALTDQIYAEGPGSSKVSELEKENENSYYIHETYRGGTWEKLEDGRWKLLDDKSQPVSSKWAIVDSKTYLLDMYGVMLTGFQKVNDSWYYFNSVGAMQTGWLLKEGKYYFLNSDGTMAYGWVNSQGSWYYLQTSDGVMLTNAYAPDGRYVNAEGVLVQ